MESTRINTRATRIAERTADRAKASERLYKIVILESKIARDKVFQIDFSDQGTQSSPYHITNSEALRTRSVVDNRGRIRVNSDGAIEWISPRDPRYLEATRRLRHIENSLGANYLDYVRKGPRVQSWTLRRIGRRTLSFIKKNRYVQLLAAGGTLLTMLKAKTASASETIAKAIEEAAGGVVAGGGHGSGDQPPLEVYLDTLKEGVERLSPTDPGFSRSRPHLRSELNDAYQAISNDSDLGKEEKARLLGKIRQVQIAIPAPQLRPSPSPNRRRGGGKR